MLKALNHRILFSLVMGAGLIGSAVLAHHGVSGQYDSSSPIVLSGMVTRATFAPPHPVLSVRVEGRDVPALDLNRPDEFTGPFIVREEDVGEVREIEFSPVGEFYALGDRIRVSGVFLAH